MYTEHNQKIENSTFIIDMFYGLSIIKTDGPLLSLTSDVTKHDSSRSLYKTANTNLM